MQKVTIGDAIAAAFGTIGTAWSQAGGAMILLVVSAAALQTVQSERPEWFLATFAGAFLALAVSNVAFGALYRIGLAGGHEGDAAFASRRLGLQWGALEWRVLGANVLLAVLLGALFIVLFIVWAIGLGITMAGHPEALQELQSGGSGPEQRAALLHLMSGPAGIVTAVILGPGLIALAWLAIRLSLFAIAAADMRSFDLGKAWALTRGATLALLLTYVVIYLAEGLLGLVLGALGGVVALSLHGGPSGGAIAGAILAQTVGACVNVPLFAGLQTYVYNVQRGDGGVAATFA